MATAPIKKTGMTGNKSNALGGGGRFQQMENKGMSAGLAATIGRKLYGKKKMIKMAQGGKNQTQSGANSASA